MLKRSLRIGTGLLTFTFALGALVTGERCGGGSGGSGGATGSAGTTGAGGTTSAGGTTGAAGSVAGATGGGGRAGTMGAGGAAGAPAITWHCTEVAGRQCLCDSLGASPQPTCTESFTCCFSYLSSDDNHYCACENRPSSECNILLNAPGTVRQTSCPPP